jgi:hypothetical protein
MPKFDTTALKRIVQVYGPVFTALFILIALLILVIVREASRCVANDENCGVSTIYNGCYDRFGTLALLTGPVFLSWLLLIYILCVNGYVNAAYAIALAPIAVPIIIATMIAFAVLAANC